MLQLKQLQLQLQMSLHLLQPLLLPRIDAPACNQVWSPLASQSSSRPSRHHKTRFSALGLWCLITTNVFEHRTQCLGCLGWQGCPAFGWCFITIHVLAHSTQCLGCIGQRCFPAFGWCFITINVLAHRTQCLGCGHFSNFCWLPFLIITDVLVSSGAIRRNSL